MPTVPYLVSWLDVILLCLAQREPRQDGEKQAYFLTAPLTTQMMWHRLLFPFGQRTSWLHGIGQDGDVEQADGIETIQPKAARPFLRRKAKSTEIFYLFAVGGR